MTGNLKSFLFVSIYLGDICRSKEKKKLDGRVRLWLWFYLMRQKGQYNLRSFSYGTAQLWYLLFFAMSRLSRYYSTWVCIEGPAYLIYISVIQIHLTFEQLPNKDMKRFSTYLGKVSMSTNMNECNIVTLTSCCPNKWKHSPIIDQTSLDWSSIFQPEDNSPLLHGWVRSK